MSDWDDIPASINVGALSYVVWCDKAHHDEATADAGEPIMGVTDTDKLTISIRPTAPRRIQEQTLLHEALHTLMHQVGIHADLGEKKEESVVARLAPALHALLRDNPLLVAFILGEHQ